MMLMMVVVHPLIPTHGQRAPETSLVGIKVARDAIIIDNE